MRAPLWPEVGRGVILGRVFRQEVPDGRTTFARRRRVSCLGEKVLLQAKEGAVVVLVRLCQLQEVLAGLRSSVHVKIELSGAGSTDVTNSGVSSHVIEAWKALCTHYEVSQARLQQHTHPCANQGLDRAYAYGLGSGKGRSEVELWLIGGLVPRRAHTQSAPIRRADPPPSASSASSPALSPSI